MHRFAAYTGQLHGAVFQIGQMTRCFKR